MNQNTHHNPAACLSVLGTGSDVGKSIITTAICRILSNRGLKVAPFKAQNMSNNSGVTPEGLEMGRAQIVQAEAARIPPHVDMNPILLKPTSEVGSQVVLLGRAVADRSAAEYHAQKETLFQAAKEALDRLRGCFEVVVLEGAGSCAEVNLMPRDIVNLPMATHAGGPVLLVADIHRGGVFAQIVGTLACLPEHFQRLITGFVINRFRGDIALFSEGAKWIEAQTGKPVFGILPWYHHISIEAEDSVVIENPGPVAPENMAFPAIAVIRFPHIANFNDVDPLRQAKGLHLYFLEKVQDLSKFVAVILPGSKNTRYDLAWLQNQGWGDAIRTYAQKGGHLLGICGGYQMLGLAVHDPGGLEGSPGSSKGLGLLPIETVLQAPKTTTLTRFFWEGLEGAGYEIHMGRTDRLAGSPLFKILSRNGAPEQAEDGCISADAQVMGTYVHGLFDTPQITQRWLGHIGLRDIAVSGDCGLAAREREYDLLAAHFEKHIDTKRLFSFMDIRNAK